MLMSSTSMEVIAAPPKRTKTRKRRSPDLNLLDIPNELLMIVMKHACREPVDIISFSLVCSRFLDCTKTESIWKHICMLRFKSINSSTLKQSGSYRSLIQYKSIIENGPWTVKPKEPSACIYNDLLGITSLAINDHFIACGGGIFDEPFDVCALFIERTINVYDRKHHRLLDSVRSFMGAIADVQVRGNYLVAAGSGGRSRLWKWNPESGSFGFRRTFKGHGRTVSSVKFNDRLLVTASRDTTVKLYDFKTSNEIRTLKGHSKALNTLAFDGTSIVSAGLDKTIKYWDVETGKLKTSLSNKNWFLTAELKDSVVITGGEGKTKIWDLREGTCVRAFACGISFAPAWITSLQCDENKIIGGSFNRRVHMWDYGSGKMFNRFTAHDDHISTVFVDQQSLWSASRDRTVKRWDFDNISDVAEGQFESPDQCSVQ